MSTHSTQPPLNIWAFADVHSPDAFHLSKIDPESCDLVVTLGDIGPGTLDLILHNAGNIPVVGVPGNHDSDDLPGIINVHKTTTTVKGVTIGGFGGAKRYKPEQYHYYEWQVALAMQRMPQVDIFLTHAPPACTTDPRTEGPLHQGFKSFDRYLKKRPPKLWMHGHIYRSYDLVKDDTRIICVQERQYIAHQS